MSDDDYDYDGDDDDEDDDDVSGEESEDDDDEIMDEATCTDNDEEGDTVHASSSRDSSPQAPEPTDFERLHDAFSDNPQFGDHGSLLLYDDSYRNAMDLDSPGLKTAGPTGFESVIADVVGRCQSSRQDAMDPDSTLRLPSETEMPELQR